MASPEPGPCGGPAHAGGGGHRRERAVAPRVPTGRIGLCVVMLVLAGCNGPCNGPGIRQRTIEAGDPFSTAADWRDSAEEVTPDDDPRVQRVRETFRRVSAASGRHAELFVLELGPTPVAIALADPAVVLSHAGVDLCYRGVSTTEGDARLAFVLGHELGHLRNGDFWHATAIAKARGLGDDETARALKDLLAMEPRDRQKAELRADGEGALAVLMANLDPGALFQDDQSFFEEWVDAAPIRSAYDADHPRTSERATWVQAQLRDVASQTSVFESGVAAFEAQDYEAAVRYFSRFQRIFPGREVRNNLGLSHLRLAAAELGHCDGSLVGRYYVPEALDDETLAERRALRGSGDHSSPCFDGEGYSAHLDEARRLFEEAMNQDPEYPEARLNLIATYVLDEQAAAAAEEARKARERWPDDGDLAVAWSAGWLFYLESGSKWVDSDAILEEVRTLRKRFPDEPGLAFNLGAFLLRQARWDEAQPVLREFLEAEPDGQWAEIARGWLGDDPPAPPPPPS